MLWVQTVGVQQRKPGQQARVERSVLVCLW